MRGLDLEKLDFPLPGYGAAATESESQLQFHRSLSYVETLLPSWADNISLTYFNHARTFPISIGG
jgi:hypothetical protein